ncbi:glutaredoxin family protein [Euzebya sp.]|uniref:glutaredoxin family protein n=1 Tax=Euzebya sp. TaxID=1971409 RepID=UPI0035174892
MSTITVYSRRGCHLCEEAEAVVARVAGDGHVVEVVDIDTDPALVDAYTVRVPVVAVDGREVAEFVVDETTLRLALD